MPAQQGPRGLPETAVPAQAHRITMENRRVLLITGVSRIVSCDEGGALLQTPLGDLTVGGEEMQVSELSVRTGEVHISGKIAYLQYAENRQSAGGFWRRLFH